MSIFYDQDEYELSSDSEINDLLADLPFDLIKESIFEQINNPIINRTNYIDIILDKIEIYKDQYSENEYIIEELDNQLNVFFTDIIKAIDSKFGLDLDIDEIAYNKNMVDIAESIYKYFIIRYLKNITRFITKYIMKHKKAFYKSFDDKNKKDVSTLAYKKSIENPDDLCILTNLPFIIKEIINTDISSEEFLELSANEGNYDANVIRGLIKSSRLNGDFYSSYISMCVVDHDYILDELQTDIKIKIINKL